MAQHAHACCAVNPCTIGALSLYCRAVVINRGLLLKPGNGRVLLLVLLLIWVTVMITILHQLLI